MRQRWGIAVVLAVLVAAALVAVPSALAATTFGRSCEADSSVPHENTVYEVLGALRVNPGVPADGVITRWQLNVPDASFSATQRLKVVRGAGDGSGENAVVGESIVESVSSADAGVPTRIPVKEDDFLGLSSQGEGGAVFTCATASTEEVLGIAPGDLPVGSRANFMNLGLGDLPVQVTIEPDVDGDGYGDETQDACPADGTAHELPCPPLYGAPPTVPTTPHPAGKAVVHQGSVTVKASTDVAGPVTVSAKAKLGKGRTATLSGGTKTLAAGQLGSFTLKFTRALEAKLAALPAGRKLKLAVTISASGAGVPGAQTLTVKLPGQASTR